MHSWRLYMQHTWTFSICSTANHSTCTTSGRFHLRHSWCAAVHGIEDSKGHAATAADANELICISKAKLLSMSSRPIRKLQSRSLQLPLAQVPQHSLLPAQVSGQEVYAVWKSLHCICESSPSPSSLANWWSWWHRRDISANHHIRIKHVMARIQLTCLLPVIIRWKNGLTRYLDADTTTNA